MPLILWLAFLAFPALEIVLLVKIGGAIGAWPTVGLVLLGFLAGGLLLHRQGLSTLARVRAEFAEGKLPVETLLNGLILSIAALALLFPGVVSDALAPLGQGDDLVRRSALAHSPLACENVRVLALMPGAPAKHPVETKQDEDRDRGQNQNIEILEPARHRPFSRRRRHDAGCGA